MTSKQDEKRWQDTLDALESVKEGKVIDGEKVHDWLESWGTAQEQNAADEVLAKNQKLLQTLGGILSMPADGSVNYKHDVQRYLDEKFR